MTEFKKTLKRRSKKSLIDFIELLLEQKDNLENALTAELKTLKEQCDCNKNSSKKEGFYEGQKECTDFLLMLMSLEMDQLRKQKVNFDIHEDSDGKWAVVTHYCNLGGCEMPSYFKTERLARIYALGMTHLGATPNCDETCSACYSEYITNCM